MQAGSTHANADAPPAAGAEFPAEFPNYAPFLQWLVFASVLLFAAWLAWKYGLPQDIFATDPTRLSLLIALLFVGGAGHCALRAMHLSAQFRDLDALLARPAALQVAGGELRFDGAPLRPSLLTRYLNTARAGDLARTERMYDSLEDAAVGSHRAGWFLTGLLTKLGLLGTVVGFILMMASVSTVASFDPSQAYELFSRMASGMRVALNTTLVGLTGSMLLGLQYLMLDRIADRLLAAAMRLAETRFPARAA